MALSELENNTIKLMREVMDPTSDRLELYVEESDMHADYLSFDKFSEDFFQAVASDEILSVYDQDHIREVVRRSCQLRPIVVGDTRELFGSVDICKTTVLCSNLFLLMNPAVNESLVQSVLNNYEHEGKDLLRHFPWAAFVYNPRGHSLFMECVKHGVQAGFFQTVFSELETSMIEFVRMYNGNSGWFAWIKETAEMADISWPIVARKGKFLFVCTKQGVFESNEKIPLEGDEEDVISVLENIYGFYNGFYNMDLDLAVFRYLNLAKWARAMARIANLPEPTFALESVL